MTDRKAAGITSALTLAWYAAGVAVWPDTESPVWYRIPLCAGIGLAFWFTAGWLGWYPQRPDPLRQPTGNGVPSISNDPRRSAGM